MSQTITSTFESSENFEKVPGRHGSAIQGIHNDKFTFSGFSSANGVIANGTDGGVLLTASGYSGASVTLSPSNIAGFSGHSGDTSGATSIYGFSSFFDTREQPSFSALVMLDSDLSGLKTFWSGLKLTNSPTSDPDCCFFRMRTAQDSTWTFVIAKNGVEHIYAWKNYVFKNGLYLLEIIFNADKTVTAKINGDIVNEYGENPAIQMNTVSLLPFSGAKADETTAIPKFKVFNYTIGKPLS